MKNRKISSNFKKITISLLSFLMILGFFVFQKFNPIMGLVKNVNSSYVASAKPELFEIDLDLNELGYKMVNLEELRNIYSDQKCYLKNSFSVDELANMNTEPTQDFDNDGLSNELEMVLNSNPKSSQTQPDIDDKVLYQDSKSPFNSKQIDKNKFFIINNTFIGESGEELKKLINNNCEKGLWFFDLYNKEQLFKPAEMIKNNNPTKPAFNFFSKKELELAKNSELNLFLLLNNDSGEIKLKELEKYKQKYNELTNFTIESKDSEQFFNLYDYYSKIIEALQSTDQEVINNKYKELLFIIKKL